MREQHIPTFMCMRNFARNSRQPLVQTAVIVATILVRIEQQPSRTLWLAAVRLPNSRVFSKASDCPEEPLEIWWLYEQGALYLRIHEEPSTAEPERHEGT